MVSKNEIRKELAPAEHPKITIFSDWCKSCGICVAFCPKEVLAMEENGRVFAKSPEKCIACHMCELRCPDFAINVEDTKRAASSGEDLK